ncbi:hypothetical protein Tco_0018983 [Tanacetum coccineum]
MSVIPLPNVIHVDVGASVQGSNKLSETSHDTSNKFFNTETFIKKLNVNIVACNYLNNGMLLNLIKNLYVPFGIPFDPKLFYKDGIKLGQYGFPIRHIDPSTVVYLIVFLLYHCLQDRICTLSSNLIQDLADTIDMVYAEKQTVLESARAF